MIRSWLNNLAAASACRSEMQYLAAKTAVMSQELFEGLKCDFWNSLDAALKEAAEKYNRIAAGSFARRVEVIGETDRQFGLGLFCGDRRLDIALQNCDWSLRSDRLPMHKLKPNLLERRLELRRTTGGGKFIQGEVGLEDFVKIAFKRLLQD